VRGVPEEERREVKATGKIEKRFKETRVPIRIFQLTPTRIAFGGRVVSGPHWPPMAEIVAAFERRLGRI
jgi:hypothetical protein